MIFRASLDHAAVLITVFVSVIFAAIIMKLLYHFSLDTGYMLVSLPVILLLLSIYWAAFLYRPLNYEIKEGSILIHRPIKDIIIDQFDIKMVVAVEARQLKSTLRTFGVGGLFGYFGRFYNATIGSMTLYATKHNKDSVMIKTTNNRIILITPDEPEKFVAEFKKSTKPV